MKQMHVRPRKLPPAIDAKCVVPHDPAACREPDLVLGIDLQLGGVLVPDRQPKRAARLQQAVNLFHPLPRPVDILVVGLLIVVLVIFVADVKRRIGEHEIDRAAFDLPHQLQAIALMNFAHRERTNGDSDSTDMFQTVGLDELDEKDERGTSIW